MKIEKTIKGVSELRGPALVCLRAIDKNQFIGLPQARILNVQDIIKEKPRRQVQIYFQPVLLPPPSPVLANIHSILAYDVPGTEDVGLPTKFGFNVGPALLPIAGSMPVNRLPRWPLDQHYSNQNSLSSEPQI